MNKISLAYSPDTDDAFMVYALKQGLLSASDVEFEFVSADIQALNKEALKATYDITAISMALYPSIKDDYELLPIGASVGDKFGPVVVVPEKAAIENISDLAGRKIAIPGEQTSAFFAAKDLLPDAEWIATPFDQIEARISAGEVDAGILIHELQLRFEKVGLRKITDIGHLWNERYHLPLPLGGIVIRRNLATVLKKSLLKLYRESIEFAFKNREQVLARASEWAKEGLDKELSETYIDMYVNHDSLSLREEVLKGMEQLFACGFQHGLCEKVSFENSVITE